MTVTVNKLSLSPNVLVVEDEPIIRICAADTLAEAGVTVLEACHAHEAIEIPEQDYNRIRVVFTDVSMPGTVDGTALAHHNPANLLAQYDGSPLFEDEEDAP